MKYRGWSFMSFLVWSRPRLAGDDSIRHSEIASLFVPDKKSKNMRLLKSLPFTWNYIYIPQSKPFFFLGSRSHSLWKNNVKRVISPGGSGRRRPFAVVEPGVAIEQGLRQRFERCEDVRSMESMSGWWLMLWILGILIPVESAWKVYCCTRSSWVPKTSLYQLQCISILDGYPMVMKSVATGHHHVLWVDHHRKWSINGQVP